MQDNTNNEIIEMNVRQDMYNRNKNKYLNALSKITEKAMGRRIQLQVKRGETITPPNFRLTDEEFYQEQAGLLKIEEEYESNRLNKVLDENGYKDKTDYTFITLNAKPEIPFDELKTATEDIVSKIGWIRDNEYSYVYEQRGDNPDEYSGYHVHMVVKTKDTALTQIRRDLKRKAARILDMDIVKSFDMGKNRKGPLSILPNRQIDNTLKYMLDWKKDIKKHAKQIIDKEFREKYKLDRIYDNPNFENKLSSLYIGDIEDGSCT